MSMECEQRSLRDGTCEYAWEETGMFDRNGDMIMLWDSDNYCCDPYEGFCDADGWEFPGDACESYNPSNSGDYCDHCGEYLGYHEGDEDDEEESECRCND